MWLNGIPTCKCSYKIIASWLYVRSQTEEGWFPLCKKDLWFTKTAPSLVRKVFENCSGERSQRSGAVVA